ncbi:MAG: rRNA adenine N-6-methyltransferase family protein [Candidatus Paceibacterota bacterium]
MKFKYVKTEMKNDILYAGEEPLVALSEKELQEFFIKRFIRKSDKVLEIGYGLGLSAKAIADIKPKVHVIVELNRELCERAENEISNAEIVNDNWKNLEVSLFKKIDKVVYEVGPEKSNLEGKDFALAHVKPAVEVILKKINVGASVGVIDPSGELSDYDIKRIAKCDVFVNVVKCPDDLVPKGLPWFENGCNFLYIEKL